MSPIAILHLDESCLGNGREGENPGGSAGLIEARTVRGRIERRDYYISSPATTNNRMALSGAIAALQLLARKKTRMRVLMVSDSQYLVKGMREWVPAWQARGWSRKGGPIENLELWRALSAKEPGYCPPMIYEAGGKRQLIIWHGESANGLDPETGQVYWTVPFPSLWVTAAALPM